MAARKIKYFIYANRSRGHGNRAYVASVWHVTSAKDKLILRAYGPTREAAIERARAAIRES